MAVIDLTSDRGFVHFRRLVSSLPELPGFVKEAQADECSEVAELPSHAFADAIGKKFPIHTKAAAFLSYLYFKDQEPSFTKEAAARIRSKFEGAAQIWGIRTEMRQADQALEPQVEKYAGADDYALNVGSNSFFPVTTPREVIDSANSLILNRGNFTYAMRKEAASNLMRAAVAHGFKTRDLPEELHFMAGCGLCEKSAAVHEISRRGLFAAGCRSPLAENMNKLAADLGKVSTLTPDLMTKVAEIVDVVDRELQITKEYGGAFAFPEDVFFGSFTEKKGEHIKQSTVVMLTGRIYTLDQLSKSAEALKVFGDDFYSDVVRMDGSVDLSKVADVLPTMPRDSAALFDHAMNSVR